MKQILKYLFFLLIGIIIFLLYNGKDGFSIGGVRVKVNISRMTAMPTYKYGEIINEVRCRDAPVNDERNVILNYTIQFDDGEIDNYDDDWVVADTDQLPTTCDDVQPIPEGETPIPTHTPTHTPTPTPTPTPGTSQFNIGDRVLVTSTRVDQGTIGTIVNIMPADGTGQYIYRVLIDGVELLFYEDFLEPAPADEPAPAPIPEDVPPAPIPEHVPPAPAEPAPAPAPARRARINWFGCASGGGGKHYM